MFPAEVATDRARKRSDGDGDRPEDGEDEESTDETHKPRLLAHGSRGLDHAGCALYDQAT